MSGFTALAAQVRLDPLVMARGQELIALVKSKHPDARFIGPRYWPTENLWLIDAYFGEGEDFELEDRLSERETDILLSEKILFCVLPQAQEAFPSA